MQLFFLWKLPRVWVCNAKQRELKIRCQDLEAKSEAPEGQVSKMGENSIMEMLLKRIESLDNRLESVELKIDKRLRPLEKAIAGAFGAIGTLSLVAIIYQAFFK